MTKHTARILPLVLLVAVLLAACTPAAAPQPAAPVEVTRIVEVTRPVEVTRLVEVTRQVQVEVTRLVEAAAAPPTATPVPAAALPRVISREPQTQDQGGVVVTVTDVRLLDWAQASQLPDAAELAQQDAFADATVVGSITLSITNNTKDKALIYPDQGTVVVGSEQVDLMDFFFFGDDVGGTLFPGVTNEGTILFALHDTPWEKVAAGASLLYEIDGPTDEQYDSLGDAYQFTAQLQPE